jgi:hypothetical protein
MRLNCTYAAAIAAVIWLACPTQAHAQYRNSSIGLDIGYMLITRPTVGDGSGLALASPDSRGNRLARGFRFGGEGNFKLHHDHWWFDARLALNFPTFGNSQALATNSVDDWSDYNANLYLGTIMGLEGLAGIRYYIWTDHVRPYIQVALSYTHIWTFGSGAGATCDSANDGLCVQSGTMAAEFLPHVNLLGVHVTPGFEFVVVKDFAIHLFFDLERSVNFQAAGNNLITFGLGVMFYS